MAPSPGRRTIVAGGLLLVMPWVAGVGTNNHLWLLALNLFAATLAFMVTVLAHIDSARSGARVLGFATIAVAVAVELGHRPGRAAEPSLPLGDCGGRDDRGR